MRVLDFIALTKLHTHNDLIEMGLVVPLDLHGEHEGVSINFISHEWLGFDEADPQGVHLRTMQEVFRRIISQEDVFRSEDDWQAYAHGFKTNGGSIVQLDSSSFLEALGAASRTPWEFRQSIEAGWVWMDFISIPQTVGLRSEAKFRTAQHDQARAVRSIPYYIKNAGNFWICAPSTQKRDGTVANYATWAARGWCRLEDVTNTLTKLGDGRALLVTHPFGEPPALTADKIHVYSQRYNAVLTGAYSCCQKGHQALLTDGTTATLDCDKIAIRELLGELFYATMNALRKDFIDNPTFGSFGNIWELCDAKNISFHKYLQLSVTRPMIMAETCDDPDWVALGWSMPFDRIGEAELSAYWAHYGLQWPQPASAMVLPALEGNLPMLRYCIEIAGCNAACSSPTGLSPLIAAARGGHRAVVSYLCGRLDVADINYQTEDSGLSALADAARRNHPDVVRELLKHGARVDIRRSDGKTPYLLAVREGHALCMSILLEAGADTVATDYDGRSASDLISMNSHLTNNRWELSSCIQSHGTLPKLDTSDLSAVPLVALPLHLRRPSLPTLPCGGWTDLPCSFKFPRLSTGSASSSDEILSGNRTVPSSASSPFDSGSYDEDPPSPFQPHSRLYGVSSAPLSPVRPRRPSNPLHGAEQAHIRFAS
jgi:hypothetical protein